MYCIFLTNRLSLNSLKFRILFNLIRLPVLKRDSSTCIEDHDEKGYFSNEDWPKDPNKIFRAWLDELKKEPLFMSLATVSSSNIPSNRAITITEYCDQGIVFFTNYCSQKAKELEENPYCALSVWWSKRQVRIQGCACQLSDAINEKYFDSASSPQKRIVQHLRQSEPVKGRVEILQEVVDLVNRYKPPETIPRSAYWGGYLVTPFVFEFLEVRRDFIHDRVKFLKEGHPLEPDQCCVSYKGDAGWEYQWLTP